MQFWRTGVFDWNDLRHFLAVAESGSTLAASRQLRVSQATVSRRIGVLEEALGVQLFVRSPSGYALTPRGEALLPLAKDVECSVVVLNDAAAAETRRLTGSVKLTTVESAANAWVIPAIARLRQDHAEIQVEVLTSDKYLDLTRGEAEVALRFGTMPQQESLIVRHITDLEECMYASRELVTRLGRPVDFADMARYPLVSDSAPGSGRVSAWLDANVPNPQVVHRVSSVSSQIAAIRAGIGAGLLPCIMGDDLKGLVRLGPPIPELTFPVWLVTTDRARRQPHVRAVIDAVVAQIESVTNHRHEAEDHLRSA